MSNNLTVHDAVIVAQEALEVLRSNFFLANRVRRDYEKEVKTYGKSVDIPKYGTLAANDKVAGSNRTIQDVTSTSVSVTLNKHKEASFLIEDPERAFARNDILNGYVGSGMTAILEAVEADLFGLYAGLSTQRGTAGTDITEAQILLARKDLVDGKAPKKDWTLGVSTKDYNAMLSIDRFTSAEKIGQAGKIAEGSVGKIHGFDTFESQLAPVVSGSPDTTHGLAFQKDAFALVVRDLPEVPEGMGTVSAVVSDEEAGLSVRVRMNYDADKGGIATTVEILYGVAEVRDELAVDILT